MSPVERIEWNGSPIAFIVRAEFEPDATSFPTPEELNLQVGFVVYPAGGVVAPHLHLPVERRIVGTSEVLIVRKGRCETDFYNDDRQLVATRTLGPGDIMLLVSGGHGIRMLEDTVLLEVKQGPYTGLGEKRRF